MSRKAVRMLVSGVLVAALTLPQSVTGQEPTETGAARGTASRQISGEDLLADVAVLEQAYEAMHPGLYRYNSAAEIAARFSRLREQVKKGGTVADFYLDLTAFTASIRCGHTYPNYFNQNDAVAQELLESPLRLPFYFRWIDGRMIVTRDLTADAALGRGAEVVEIDGVAAGALLAKLMPLTRADGSNDAKRRALLGDTGAERWEAFDVLYPLAFPRPAERKTFSLRIRAEGETIRAVTVTGMSAGERRQLGGQGNGVPGKEEPLFTKARAGGGVMVITMPSWSVYNSRWDWKTWLDGALDEAVDGGAKGLLLDLRGNEGGLSEVGDLVLSRLLAKSITVPPMRRLVRFEDAPKELMPYLQTWDKSFAHLGSGAPVFQGSLPHLAAGTWYDLDRDGAKALEIAPHGKRFGGKVVVLIDGQNSSATFGFAQTMQKLHLGELVGEPTGGNQRGINGGSFFFLNLPKSKLEVDLPLVGTFPEVDVPDAGLMPDRRVEVTRKDVTDGRDSQMAEALALMQ